MDIFCATLRFTVMVTFLGELSTRKISSMLFLINERQHVPEILSFSMITTPCQWEVTWQGGGVVWWGRGKHLLDKQGSTLSNIYYITFKAKVTFNKINEEETVFRKRLLLPRY